MQIDINENYLEQIVEVNGKIFKVIRLPKEIKWECLNCGSNNYNDDDYIEDNFVECSNCKEEFGIDLDENGNIENIQTRMVYENPHLYY